VATFSVSPDELARVAGVMGPEATEVTSAAGTISGSVTPVGLSPLDGALSDVADVLGGWLSKAGTDLETLAYNTQLAAAIYARVEADNVAAAGGGNESSGCSRDGCVA
jgi:hypothetical protein